MSGLQEAFCSTRKRSSVLMAKQDTLTTTAKSLVALTKKANDFIQNKYTLQNNHICEEFVITVLDIE